jgi:predicted nucleotidyltransferase
MQTIRRIKSILAEHKSGLAQKYHLRQLGIFGLFDTALNFLQDAVCEE